MPNVEFTNKVITTAGRNFIAGLVAGDKVEFVQALAIAEYKSPAQIATITASDFSGGPVGIIKQAVPTGNIARVIVEFSNQPATVIAKTVAVTVRKYGTSDQPIVLMAQSDQNIGLLIPDVTVLSAATELVFNVAIGNGTVHVVEGNNVSLGEWQNHLNRTVTTHSQNSTSAGDNQNIFGEKVFKNVTTFESNAVASNILPRATGSYNLGSSGPSGYKWNYLYSNYIGDSSNYVTSAYITTINGTTFTGTADKATKDASGNTITSYYCNVSTDQTISGKKSFNNLYIPYQHSITINSLWSNSFNSGITLNNANDNQFKTHISENTSSSPGIIFDFLVGSTSRARILTTTTITNNSLTEFSTYPANNLGNNTWSIGTSNYKLKEVWAASFNGHATSATNLSYVSNSTVANKLVAEDTQVTSNTNIIPSVNSTSTSTGLNLGSTDKKWKYVYTRYLGDSSTHLYSAYIDNIYVSSSNTSLLNYIKGTTVTNAINATNATNSTNVYVTGTTGNYNYPLVFAGSTGTSSANKPIYMDSSSSYQAIYNPNSHLLWSRYIGNSSNHIPYAYIDTLYVTSNGTSLSSYIGNQMATRLGYTYGSSSVGTIKLWCVTVGINNANGVWINEGTTFTSTGVQASDNIYRAVKAAVFSAASINGYSCTRINSYTTTIYGTWKVITDVYLYNSSTSNSIEIPFLAVRIS